MTLPGIRYHLKDKEPFCSAQKIDVVVVRIPLVFGAMSLRITSACPPLIFKSSAVTSNIPRITLTFDGSEILIGCKPTPSTCPEFPTFLLHIEAKTLDCNPDQVLYFLYG
ncbi:MAG: hypothetical protein Ct9H300mP28_20950 [Pseudomonadota bacterium]|nr:MAG: hypothetical protein Ct9H300mP28_20950 [Pseudomonadota bacterium]